jgi:acetyl-CoA/propionyl-CoA carboxylase biotin carboxyl carrier protein
MFRKVLIASRGEIAARIVRACAELGVSSVVVFSDADEKARHVRLAGEAVRLPGSSPADTYLNAERIVEAAVATGADAVHPGYGFLSENAEFAARVRQAGCAFVGPSAETIAALGDKVAARALAVEAGIPVVPGHHGDTTTSDTTTSDLITADLRRLGAEHGWPLLLKAAHGGGGRGLRVVRSVDELDDDLVEQLRASAATAFGDGTVYAERYLEQARHIEVQILADQHGTTVSLGDRDCSVQRRHQKLLEEAPAPGLSDGLRAGLADAARRLAVHAGYTGVGTVEFLVEGENFYFLEMNTRLQVEHTVTEEVFGLDLVHEQLRVAAGEPVGEAASRGVPRGHAIECRINAEDPADGFRPTPGRIEELRAPLGPGVRLDTGYESGDEVPPFYDSLIAKLIVWAPTRETAVSRLRAALEDLRVDGVPTTVGVFATVARDPDFRRGGVTTRWFEETLAPVMADAPGTAPPELSPEPPGHGAWIGGRFHRLPVLARDAAPGRAAGQRRPSARRDRRAREAQELVGERRITSPMQGTVIALAVADGDTVRRGEVLVTVEAMKMENAVVAPTTARVKAVAVRTGALVALGDLLLTLEPVTTADADRQPEGAPDAAV